MHALWCSMPGGIPCRAGYGDARTQVGFRFRDRKGISAIPPEQYMLRFQSRVVQEVRLGFTRPRSASLWLHPGRFGCFGLALLSVSFGFALLCFASSVDCFRLGSAE